MADPTPSYLDRLIATLKALHFHHEPAPPPPPPPPKITPALLGTGAANQAANALANRGNQVNDIVQASR
jgi:hypothetical protein